MAEVTLVVEGQGAFTASSPELVLVWGRYEGLPVDCLRELVVDRMGGEFFPALSLVEWLIVLADLDRELELASTPAASGSAEVRWDGGRHSREMTELTARLRFDAAVADVEREFPDDGGDD